MNKLIVVALAGLLLVSCVSILNNYKEDLMKQETKVFQGPVMPTDDLEHFRKTGETIKKVTIKNPATGEVWNSVERFENRKLNLMEVDN